MQFHLLRPFLPAMIVLAAPVSTQALPLGHWARGDGNAKVMIERCGTSLCAINTWVKDNSHGENVGDKLVMSVRETGARHYAGTAFDPQRNRSYGISITYSDTRMITRGCILKIVCKAVNWTRIP